MAQSAVNLKHKDMMPLDNDSKAFMRMIVQEAVADSMKNHCNFSEESVKTLKHLSYIMGDIGNGDHRKGVEYFKAQSKFIHSLMKTRNRIGNAVLVVSITVLMGGFLTWLGSAIYKSFKG